MAKYSKTDRGIGMDTAESFMMTIANELAESNRLKRLEMKYVETQSLDNTIIDAFTDDELEDQA